MIGDHLPIGTFSLFSVCQIRAWLEMTLMKVFSPFSYCFSGFPCGSFHVKLPRSILPLSKVSTRFPAMHEKSFGLSSWTFSATSLARVSRSLSPTGSRIPSVEGPLRTSSADTSCRAISSSGGHHAFIGLHAPLLHTFSIGSVGGGTSCVRCVHAASALRIACRTKAGGSRRPPSSSPDVSSGAANAPPKITSRRPGLLASIAAGKPLSGRNRLVGGQRSSTKVVFDDGVSSSRRRNANGENIELHACQTAPQRPTWWRFGKKGSVLSGKVGADTSSENSSWSTPPSSYPRRENLSPGKAPLNPLHSMEKMSWISLLGGSGPPNARRRDDGDDSRVTRSSSSFFFSKKKKRSSASPLEQDLNTTRSTTRFLQAAKALHGKKKGEQLAFTALLSDEQKLAIVNKEIESKWWARFWYRPFRNVTDHRLRSTKRILHTLLFVFCVAFCLSSVYFYRAEMRLIESLTPEDKADYIYLIVNMRYSDVWNMAMEVLNKEDPLEALPAPVRYHLALEEARRRGWTSTVDWKVEQRVLHPLSAVEEGDFVHIFFWAIMYIGSIASGGGSSIFTSRFLGEAADATIAAQQEVTQTEPKLIGPTAPSTL